jgi:hypothetical protein
MKQSSERVCLQSAKRETTTTIMRFLIVLLAVLAVCSFGENSHDSLRGSDGNLPEKYLNATTAAGCSVYQSATCKFQGTEGVCVSKSSGCCKGKLTTGLCPGNSDIQCCYDFTCSTPSGNGICKQTSLCGSEGGVSHSGYCDGPKDLQCCVKGGSGGVTRSEMIQRSQDWVNRKVPYSQSATTGRILLLFF